MITGTVSPSTFEWKIPSRILISERNRLWMASPEFRLPDSSLCMQLYLFKESINIYVSRIDSGGSKTITYKIKVYSRTDVKKFTGNILTQEKWMHEGFKFKRDVARDSDLLITCYIKCNTPFPVSGRKSCAVQTNVPDSVSCAVQTNVPDSVSCAIQTEVANSVTEKENPKDEDWPSLDMKDDALLRERMKELLIKGKDHDLTICVQDKEFRAHRTILSTRSPVFAMMLSHDTEENNTGTISIEDCDPDSFDEFLLYVYSGRTENLTSSNALQLYYPADKYDFPVLKERCVNLLKTSLSVESICDVVLLAAKHQEKELLEVATEFFARNIKKILITVGWQKFMSQNLVEANELYIKSMEILHPEN